MAGVLTLGALTSTTLAAETGFDHFETSVRPLLVEHCQSCHGAKKQEGGLRLDLKSGPLTGGDSGPAIVPGQPGESLLLKAVRHEDGLEMPPRQPQLSADAIAALEQWISAGAAWPEADAPTEASIAERAAGHWAFQPVSRPEPPEIANSDWVRTPIDRFVLARLNATGLSPSPEADRRTLIRRATYALTGLPPTADAVEAFVADPAPEAYEALVERLLDSPQFGEHWARQWLDLARYSDTKGYVYAREERFWTHAWTYRDWIVRALNEDLPYDRFLLLQLAADQVEDARPDDLAAMGFLTLGRRFLGVKRDIIDDRIDVVTRGTMGLTAACARCHDHKYDPIPTADYYSLYGVFDSCREERVPLGRGDEAFEAELASRQRKLDELLQSKRVETAARVRGRIGDYLQAQFELENYPEEGFDQVIQTTDLLPSFVRRWQAALRAAEQNQDPVFRAWHAFRTLPGDAFAAEAVAVAETLRVESGGWNPLVSGLFADPPRSMAEVNQRYGELFAKIDADWQAALQAAGESGGAAPEGLADPAAEEIRQWMYRSGGPCVVPDEPVVHTEYDFDSGTCNELWRLQAEVDRWIIDSPAGVAQAVLLRDRETPAEPRIFRRGNPANLGEDVPRRFLELLAGPDRRPFETGSGRLEMAQRIVDPENPLTARVFVNRVWMGHFGEGLVTTPSDFGTRAEPPSHPELLDWLAASAIDGGWSVKALHRMIVLSATFRQSSSGPEDADALARAQQLDPANRLLWRMNARRLSFEEFRDSLLAASGELDPQSGGKPVNLFATPYPRRRTLYGLVDRQFLPATLRIFDFANPDLHLPKRAETTVPQQALFLLNHPLMLERVRALAGRIQSEPESEGAVVELFQRALQRPPSADESLAALELLAIDEPLATPEASPTAGDWTYGFGAYEEAGGRTRSFTPLPHFTGTAWQGGPSFPDGPLGWVQLTADGGHPGNDRAHASIRRWTAPRAGSIAIQSRIVHEPPPGDGIRAFVVSSRTGLLQFAKVHQQTSEWSLAALTVEPGETIDFIVDIGDELNSDQYLWSVTLTEQGVEAPVRWSSTEDFPRATPTQLSPLEQLAQVLLSSNEFLFVD
ncbi:MAG: PSD1 domain-containing protein [Planctomyces sp.]|nr:PSD1 domain-containing protein [Planctomyces sp.]